MTAEMILVAVMPLVVIVGGLWLAQHVQDRRAASVQRQIALTDAVHRELGAAAAPVVTRRWRGTWVVRMPAPLDSVALVGTLARITHELFARLDRTENPRVDVVFTTPDPILHRRAARLVAGSSPQGLRPLGARLG
jgi:hypothetical protein